MSILPFTQSTPFTMGIELELQLVNRRNYNLATDAVDLLTWIEPRDLQKQIKLEITQGMIELNSSVHTRVDELVQELKDQFPKAPYIARPGNINAWDNEDFVKAVKDTGRKQLIIAGVVTEVCVAFPALSALEEGFDVFVVTDASGTFNEVTRDAAWRRMEAAGAQMMSWFGVACELHRDWRNDIEGLGRLFSNHIPDYRNLMAAYSTVKGSK